MERSRRLPLKLTGCQKQVQATKKKRLKLYHPQEIVLFVTNWPKAFVPFVNMFSTVVETAKESIGIRIKKTAKL